MKKKRTTQRSKKTTSAPQPAQQTAAASRNVSYTSKQRAPKAVTKKYSATKLPVNAIVYQWQPNPNSSAPRYPFGSGVYNYAVHHPLHQNFQVPHAESKSHQQINGLAKKDTVKENYNSASQYEAMTFRNRYTTVSDLGKYYAAPSYEDSQLPGPQYTTMSEYHHTGSKDYHALPSEVDFPSSQYQYPTFPLSEAVYTISNYPYTTLSEANATMSKQPYTLPSELGSIISRHRYTVPSFEYPNMNDQYEGLYEENPANHYTSLEKPAIRKSETAKQPGIKTRVRTKSRVGAKR